jgi:DNA topoisomerase-1
LPKPRKRRTASPGSGKPLIIVESPTKARTIERAFGKSYRVAASLGHLRDLPRSQLGVNVEQEFEPKYITVRGRGDVVRELKTAAEKAKKTLLAADPDREGEAISWHLAQLLGLDPTSPCRIVFHEITRDAIAEAIHHPRPVDMNLVDAQQARRVLDRLVGYELSPLLWRKVRRGLSAGRVQSVAVRLVCDREAEVKVFVPQEYWTIGAILSDSEPGPAAPSPGGPRGEPIGFAARLAGRLVESGQFERVELVQAVGAAKIVEEVRQATWTVLEVKKGARRRNPPAPFTTSSLQQEAAQRLGFSVRRTMVVAQQLYEGVELGEAGSVGLITYMRTDATRVADSARAEARELLMGLLGEDYLPAEPPKHKAGRRAQEAHEAVRPTDPFRTPVQVKAYLSKEQFRLYRLIWERFLASEMTPAVYDTVTAEFAAGSWGFRSSGSELRFSGFLSAYDLAGGDQAQDGGPQLGGDVGDGETSPGDGAAAPLDTAALRLPEMTQGQRLFLVDLSSEQHFTAPPPRYSEANLVKAMEELGVGRPSTYAPTIETIVSRGYVEKVDGRLVPTPLGEIVTGLLLEHFPDVVDVAFTAGLEDRLDEVEDGALPWRKVVRSFYEPFAAALGKAEAELGRIEVPAEETGLTCDVCGLSMIVKYGRYGRFLACSGYPECRRTRPFVLPTGAVCPKCRAEVVEKRTKRGRRFYGCIRYPECDFSVWSRPTDRSCPECGVFMVVASRSEAGNTAAAEGAVPTGSRWLRCANTACGLREVVPDE